MRALKLFILLPFFCYTPCFASGGVGVISSGSALSAPGSPGNTAGQPILNYGSVPNNPYLGNPYQTNPYYMYGTPNPYYRSPYSYYQAPFGYNPAPIPVFQPFGGNCYGLAFNGRNLQLWRANSGYYYPWVAGYGYTSYPIFVVPQGQTNPAAVLPPISVLVNDLNDYLDKAKEKGKVADNDFLSLKRRANDLLSKEKSLAYEAGGTLDPDQEADIRRDVDELSGEVARRVRP